MSRSLGGDLGTTSVAAAVARHCRAEMVPLRAALLGTPRAQTGTKRLTGIPVLRLQEARTATVACTAAVIEQQGRLVSAASRAGLPGEPASVGSV